MFILEDPYVSDLLAVAASELKRPVLDTPIARRSLTGPTAERLGLPDATADLLFPDAAFAAAASRLGARLYTNSEHGLEWIVNHLADTDLPRQIGLFKDKVAFRDSLADLYPGYRYVGVARADLARFDRSWLRAPVVVKPAVGFFSMFVHVVASPEDWAATVDEIEREVRAFATTYPEAVLGLDRFVVEEVIDGEEFAVDAYFDDGGTPVLVNLYAHLFSSADDVSDRVYLTNTETVDRLAPSALAFLEKIGGRAGLVDFPVHAELRVDAAGRVVPIEVNPMRFGGWCATDLAHYAYQVDPYRSYMQNERPDWSILEKQTNGRTTALIVADLPRSVDLERIAGVDYEGFAGRFSRLLEIRPMDFRRFPVFAFAFVSVPSDDLTELRAVLGADLREYVRMQTP